MTTASFIPRTYYTSISALPEIFQTKARLLQAPYSTVTRIEVGGYQPGVDASVMVAVEYTTARGSKESNATTCIIDVAAFRARVQAQMDEEAAAERAEIEANAKRFAALSPINKLAEQINEACGQYWKPTQASVAKKLNIPVAVVRKQRNLYRAWGKDTIDEAAYDAAWRKCCEEHFIVSPLEQLCEAAAEPAPAPAPVPVPVSVPATPTQESPMSTFFKAPHVDSDVTSVIKLLLGIENNRPHENLSSLPATLLNRRSGNSVSQVFYRLCLVNTGEMSAEAFVAWFDEAYPSAPNDRADTAWAKGTLGDFIASKRKLMKMTQTDLASALGVAVSQVSRWEADQGQPSNQTYTKLGHVLEIEPYILWSMANGGAVQPDDAVKAAAPADDSSLNWNLIGRTPTRVMYAEAQRQYEVDVRDCYTKWTVARDEALLLLKARLKLTDEYEESYRDDAAADGEADEYAEKWGGENVRPPSPSPYRGGPDDEEMTAYELREYLHDKASDRRDNAQREYEWAVQKIRG